MTKANCETCGKMTAAGFICTECQRRLLAILGDVPRMIGELRLALSRQAQFTHAGGRSSQESPIPWNDKASRAATRYMTTIRDWQGRLADQLEPPGREQQFVWSDAPVPFTPYRMRLSEPVRFLDPVKAALWMEDRITSRGVVGWGQAPDMFHQLRKAHKAVEAAIDRPAARWYAGQCGDWYVTPEGATTQCTQDLYANNEHGQVKCPHCGAEFSVDDRRRVLEVEADDSLVTASEAARAIVVLSDTQRGRGESKLAHHIVVWASRGRLISQGLREEFGIDRPVYRMGDIRELVNDYERREAERSARRKVKA